MSDEVKLKTVDELLNEAGWDGYGGGDVMDVERPGNTRAWSDVCVVDPVPDEFPELPKVRKRGKPKTFDNLSRLARDIAKEAATYQGEPILWRGEPISVAEAILRGWATSADPRVQKFFMETAYGVVPKRQEVTGEGGGPIQVKGYVGFSPDEWDGEVIEGSVSEVSPETAGLIAAAVEDADGDE